MKLFVLFILLALAAARPGLAMDRQQIQACLLQIDPTLDRSHWGLEWVRRLPLGSNRARDLFVEAARQGGVTTEPLGAFIKILVSMNRKAAPYCSALAKLISEVPPTEMGAVAESVKKSPYLVEATLEPLMQIALSSDDTDARSRAGYFLSLIDSKFVVMKRLIPIFENPGEFSHLINAYELVTHYAKLRLANYFESLSLREGMDATFCSSHLTGPHVPVAPEVAPLFGQLSKALARRWDSTFEVLRAPLAVAAAFLNAGQPLGPEWPGRERNLRQVLQDSGTDRDPIFADYLHYAEILLARQAEALQNRTPITIEVFSETGPVTGSLLFFQGPPVDLAAEPVIRQRMSENGGTYAGYVFGYNGEKQIGVLGSVGMGHRTLTRILQATGRRTRWGTRYFSLYNRRSSTDLPDGSEIEDAAFEVRFVRSITLKPAEPACLIFYKVRPAESLAPAFKIVESPDQKTAVVVAPNTRDIQTLKAALPAGYKILGGVILPNGPGSEIQNAFPDQNGVELLHQSYRIRTPAE